MATSLSSSLRLVTPKPLSFFFKPCSKPSQFYLSSPISFQRIQTKALNPKSETQPLSESSSLNNLSRLPPKLVEIISLFQSVPDPKTRYAQLLHYGTQLPPLDSKFKTESNRVHGCVSRVWVRAFKDSQEDSIVRFEADSDSQLTKGIAALLVLGLSGSPISAIPSVTPEFIDLLGIRQSLSPSRNSGMLNMLKLMQVKALELDAQVDNSENFQESNGNFDKIEENLEVKEVNSSFKLKLEERFADSASYPKEDKERIADTASYPKEEKVKPNGGFGGRKERIKEKLEMGLSPIELKIEDISHQHKGHAAMIGHNNGETHFNVKVISKEFEGKSLVKRHRLVYDLLKEELNSGLHALSIDAKTPSEV